MTFQLFPNPMDIHFAVHKQDILYCHSWLLCVPVLPTHKHPYSCIHLQHSTASCIEVYPHVLSFQRHPFFKDILDILSLCILSHMQMSNSPIGRPNSWPYGEILVF